MLQIPGAALRGRPHQINRRLNFNFRFKVGVLPVLPVGPVVHHSGSRLRETIRVAQHFPPVLLINPGSPGAAILRLIASAQSPPRPAAVFVMVIRP